MIEARDPGGRIEFRDYNNPEVAAETPYSLGELAFEMHLVRPDGRWFGGYDAWLEIVRALYGNAAVWIGSLFPVRWLGRNVYRLLARNRYGIARWMAGRFNIPEPCGQSCEIRTRPIG